MYPFGDHPAIVALRLVGFSIVLFVLLFAAFVYGG
jgi:hypothetical protein